MQPESPRFGAGRNIAIKVPKHRYDATVAFYRDVLRLPHVGSYAASETFEFGSLRLWIDCVPHQSQVDVWLEVRSDDPDAAARWLQERGTPVRDELEPLGDMPGHWVSDPAGVVLLLARTDEPG
jgi:catechol 2,3-dioxygenase-like lactoylglutathione lyase family enzyme